jgi:Acetyltransferases
MNLKIREAAADDYAGVGSLVSEVHRLHLENRPDVYLDTDMPFPKERFSELLQREDTKLLVAENTDSGELLAYSILEMMTPKNLQILIPSRFMYIDDFCVKSGYRKNGIGRLLFRHIGEYAKSEGISSIQLTVWEFNKNAIQFYESMGMTAMNRRMELNL